MIIEDYITVVPLDSSKGSSEGQILLRNLTYNQRYNRSKSSYKYSSNSYLFQSSPLSKLQVVEILVARNVLNEVER